jgi:hypothetical protein
MKYPKRPKMFAYKYGRLLGKTVAAFDIGADTCYMLMQIVLQEDAKRYSGPVVFWNHSLSNICGFGSPKRLINARKKAVEAGWLHYEKGGKTRAARYWVTIPEGCLDMDDAPMDEDSTELTSVSTSVSTSDLTSDLTSDSYHKAEAQTANGGSAKGNHSTLTLSPDPNPKTKGAASASLSPEDDRPEDEPETKRNFDKDFELAFVAACKQAEGMRPVRGKTLTEKRRGQLNARLGSPDWDWKAALEKFPLQAFRDGAGWQPNMEWFLRPDTVTSILEGKYDFTRSNGKPDRLDGVKKFAERARNGEFDKNPMFSFLEEANGQP